ncbi:MAG: response regulator [Actinomycetota bacterium]|nr:response regulator [Actinomycetota bacterium]
MPEADADKREDELRVLVVTDDAQLAHEASFGFPVGVRVTVVRDAREALEFAGQQTPSVVVVDLQTGSSGGIALAREMAQDDRLANVPIMMLLERPEDEWLAKRGGAHLVRTKPLDTTELVTDTLELARR